MQRLVKPGVGLENVALNLNIKENVMKNKPGFFERFWVNLFYLLFRPFIKVENIQRFEHINPVIFVFNHNTTFETVIIYAFLSKHKKIKQRVSFIIDWMFAHVPILGKFIRVIDPILVYNKKAKIKKINRKKQHGNNIHSKVIERLNKGKSIGVYPEGTRNRNPEKLKRGRKGIGMLTLDTGVFIQPIGVDFPKRRKKNKIPKIGRIIFNIGEKIDFSYEVNICKTVKNDSNLTEREKSKIIKYLEARVTHGIMQKLSGLSGKIYDFSKPSAPEIAKRYLLKGEENGKSNH